MNKKTITAGLMALAMAACTQNETTNAPTGTPITIAAGINQEPETRIAFDDGAEETKVTWTAGDKFYILAAGIEKSFHTFTIKEGEGGETRANFQNTSLNNVNVPATTIHAMYFNKAMYSSEATELNLTFNSQEGTATDRHLMMAMVDNTAASIKNWEDLDFNFKNRTAILEVTLTNPALANKKITDITITADNFCKNAKYTLADGKWTPGETCKTITISKSKTADASGTFTISIAQPPMGTTTGTITLNATADNENYTATLIGGTFGEPAMYNAAVYRAPADQSMQFTIATTVINKKFTLPFSEKTGTYTLTVDWGDGTVTTIPPNTPADDPKMSHTYAATTTYTVILGSNAPTDQAQMPSWSFLSSLTSAEMLKSMDSPLLKMNATDLSCCFYYCTALETIPADLFARNAQATRFNFGFRNCTSLTEIPNGLFGGLEAAKNFVQCFYNCTSARVNPNIFCNDATERDTHFAGKSVNFTSCFENVGSRLGIGEAGTAPRLWLYQYGSVSKEKCFYNCANMTNISAAAKAGWTH